MGVCVLVFVNTGHMRLLFQRPEWRNLTPLLYRLGPNHWRMPNGEELYVLTLNSAQGPGVVQQQHVRVYLFGFDATPRYPEEHYFLRMLRQMQQDGAFEMQEVLLTGPLDWERLGILPPEKLDS